MNKNNANPVDTTFEVGLFDKYHLALLLFQYIFLYDDRRISYEDETNVRNRSVWL